MRNNGNDGTLANRRGFAIVGGGAAAGAAVDVSDGMTLFYSEQRVRAPDKVPLHRTARCSGSRNGHRRRYFVGAIHRQRLTDTEDVICLQTGVRAGFFPE